MRRCLLLTGFCLAGPLLLFPPPPLHPQKPAAKGQPKPKVSEGVWTQLFMERDGSLGMPMLACDAPLQSNSATKLSFLDRFWVCCACMVGFHGDPSQAALESPDQRLPSDRPKEPGPVVTGTPTDRYGDPLPVGAIARLGTLRFQTLSRFIPYLAFSPDSKLIASSTFEQSVCIWEAATGKLLHRFSAKHHAKPAFSRDGKILMCQGDFWNIADGKEIKPLHDPALFLPEPKGPLPKGALAISPDGKFHAGLRGPGTIVVVDRASGKETCTFARHDHALSSLAFAPQGKTLATAAEDGTVRLWEFPSGKLLHTFPPLRTQREFIRSVGFSPDGKILAVPVEDGRNKVQGGLQAWNRLVIRRWDPSQGKELESWTTEEAAFGPTLAFAPAGDTLAFTGGFGHICLWSLASGKEVRRISWPRMRGCDSLVYAPNGKTLAAASETGLVLWEVATGQERKRFPCQDTPVISVAFSPNGKLLAKGDSSTIRVWDLIRDKEIATFLGHEGRISSLAFSPNGTILASASWDGTVRLWDMSKGKSLRCLVGHVGPVTAIAFSPDGKVLASSGTDTTVLIWDMDRIRKDPR
jgi:WD40 repeat protein